MSFLFGKNPFSYKDDTIHARSNSDFDVKYATIPFYSNNHTSQSNRWIALKCYVRSPDMLSYLGLKFQINQSLCTKFVIYFLLTCGLPIWQLFFSKRMWQLLLEICYFYKDP